VLLGWPLSLAFGDLDVLAERFEDVPIVPAFDLGAGHGVGVALGASITQKRSRRLETPTSWNAS
jgi:hypothetical protein